jgi:hypothetical protein
MEEKRVDHQVSRGDYSLGGYEGLAVGCPPSYLFSFCHRHRQSILPCFKKKKITHVADQPAVVRSQESQRVQ